MNRFIFDILSPSNIHKGIIQTEFLDNIREYFSVKDELYNIKRKKYGAWVQQRKYVITPTGRFDIGLYWDIRKALVELQIPHEIITTDKFKQICAPMYSFSLLSKLKLSLRDYQEEACTKALKFGRGIIVSATASGKTLMMATIAKTIIDNLQDQRIIIVTPQIQLVEQTYSDFAEYGIPESMMTKWSGGNEPNLDAKIIIAGSNILQSKNTDLSILGKMTAVLIDEAHGMRRGNKFEDIFKLIKTPNIFGFTGTMPEDKVDQWNVIGLIGPILYRVTSSELRETGHIASAKVKVVKIKYKNPDIYSEKSQERDASGLRMDPIAQYKEECDYIQTNAFRNNLIKDICTKLSNNVLVLVDKLDHGELLFNTIQEVAKNKKVYYIRGEVELDEREKVRKLMEENQDVICVAITKVFSTGINIKNLHYIVFASVGKAKIKILQSIGRGLRLHEHKNKLVILDIADDLIYGMKHLLKRLKLYEMENIEYEIKDFEEE